jgi:hypothetical protein
MNMLKRIFPVAVLLALAAYPAIAQDADYLRMKNACLGEFKSLGATPLVITAKAAKDGLASLTKIVQANIGKSTWSATANDQSFQDLAKLFKAFTICDIDGSLEFFPGLEDVPQGSSLAKAVAEGIEDELRFLGQRVF